MWTYGTARQQSSLCLRQHSMYQHKGYRQQLHLVAQRLHASQAANQQVRQFQETSSRTDLEVAWS